MTMMSAELRRRAFFSHRVHDVASARCRTTQVATRGERERDPPNAPLVSAFEETFLIRRSGSCARESREERTLETEIASHCDAVGNNEVR